MNIKIRQNFKFYFTGVIKCMCFRNRTVFSCNGFISRSFDAEHTVKH